MKWTRERAKSGPADTLDGRWEVQRGGGAWAIWDRRRRLFVANGYTTMRVARAAAERLARQALAEATP